MQIPRHSLASLAMLLAVSVAPLLAQKWEVGAGGGASFYNSTSVSGRTGSADVKLKTGYGFSAYFGQIGNRLGGEVRYDRLSNEMEVAGSGRSYSRSGYSQAIHYDLLVYFSGPESKTRPYLAAGGGMKQYAATGKDVPFPPLANVVILTGTSEWKPLIAAGGGVRFAFGDHGSIRAEVQLHMTQAPTRVITPVAGSLSGWLFGFAPTVSIGYAW